MFWCLLFGSSSWKVISDMTEEEYVEFVEDCRRQLEATLLQLFSSSWHPGWAVHVIIQVYLNGAGWKYDWAAEAALFCYWWFLQQFESCLKTNAGWWSTWAWTTWSTTTGLKLMRLIMSLPYVTVLGSEDKALANLLDQYSARSPALFWKLRTKSSDLVSFSEGLDAESLAEWYDWYEKEVGPQAGKLFIHQKSHQVTSLVILLQVADTENLFDLSSSFCLSINLELHFSQDHDGSEWHDEDVGPQLFSSNKIGFCLYLFRGRWNQPWRCWLAWTGSGTLSFFINQQMDILYILGGNFAPGLWDPWLWRGSETSSFLSIKHFFIHVFSKALDTAHGAEWHEKEVWAQVFS